MQHGLFDMPPRPRAKPRRLMHVIDAGERIDSKDHVHMLCHHCGHDAGWCLLKMSEAKRGVPCPVCNQGKERS